MAEVNDKGEVTVEGEFVGRLEGFRFSPDKGGAGAGEKAVQSASLQALAPQFHLRADRFYNAPDTEIDFTEQGGLMWGGSAVGKLVSGPDALKPQVTAFVDEAAGTEVAEKVQRRLQHFIDRKIAALFEPLLTLQRDETLNGLAKGFAFRMVEALGILPRAEIAAEVKDLDQEARSALRKHGVRFGQFTIFMPLLLKPAPTRLRLVLWSLARGLDEFPESPPPGLVTVPTVPDAPDGYHTMCGYRAAGERAIRIDMAERLADMLRAQDSRAGFEATPDMLSISGMTLDQFADLMQGLGYRAERGERVKIKTPHPKPVDGAQPEDQPVMDRGREVPPIVPTDPPRTAQADDIATEISDIPAEGLAPIAEEPVSAEKLDDHIPEQSEDEVPIGTAPDATPAETARETAPETEVFYTFTWARVRQGGNRPQGGRGAGKPQGKTDGKPRGKPRGKPQGKRSDDKGPQGAKTFAARPPRPEKKIDPDNPFAAALMGLRDKK